MVEILFGESEAASIIEPVQGAWIEGTADEVICLAFMLDMGDITQDIGGKYRKEFICSMLNQGQWGKHPELEQELKETADVYVGELDRLKKYLEDGETVRIWYSKSAYSQKNLLLL